MATPPEKKEKICPPRRKMDVHVDPETIKKLVTQYDVIPMFEKIIYEYNYKKHYSLNTNENLKCAWEKYKANIETRVFAPFQFPSDREIHFYNCMLRYMPSASIHTRPSYRMTLQHGPGVDSRGQLPTPQEAFLKRLGPTKKSAKKKEKKTQTHEKKTEHKNPPKKSKEDAK